MMLRVIGWSSPYAGPDEAGVGYVLEDNNRHILIECGSGVVAKYLQNYELAELDGVIISHLHPDHFLDLLPLGFALQHAKMQGLRQGRVPVFLPPSGIETFNEMLRALGGLNCHYDQVFAYREFDDAESLEIGAWKACFHQVYHGMNCHGVVLESTSGDSLGYTGDTKQGPNLAKIFQGIDLLLCEATVSSEEHGRQTSHLTPEQAGILATAANVDQLVLTHFLPGTDTEDKRKRAACHFRGKIHVAQTGVTYHIGAND